MMFCMKVGREGAFIVIVHRSSFIVHLKAEMSTENCSWPRMPRQQVFVWPNIQYIYYVCMVIHIARVRSQDQLGKVANPVRGQLNRENQYFHVPVRA